MEPTVGRIVLWTSHFGETFPAIIVAVLPNRFVPTVRLQVFGTGPIDVQESQEDAQVHTGVFTPLHWHWPPRE